MVVDVILLQDSAPVVIEIDAHLLPTVDAIMPQHRLATCTDGEKVAVKRDALGNKRQTSLSMGGTSL